MTGDSDDIKRACKKVMNQAVSNRIISKQEACVLLSDLPLVSCTETIESVSISNSKRVSAGEQDKTTSGKTLIDEYKKRPNALETFSLHNYFHYTRNIVGAKPGKKIIIANFVGVNGTPTYPVSESYARHTLIVHKPWREYPNKQTWMSEFESFIHGSDCPSSAKITYERVVRRYYDKMTHYEAKASEGDHSQNKVSEEDTELMHLVGVKYNGETDYDDAVLRSLDYGTNFNWNAPPKVCFSIKKFYYGIG